MRFPGRLIQQTTPTKGWCDETRETDLRRVNEAVKEGSVPFGYYGPETCRWATPDEMRRFGLEDCPMVHLDKSGEIDCYFTETGATAVPGASHH